MFDWNGARSILSESCAWFPKLPVQVVLSGPTFRVDVAPSGQSANISSSDTTSIAAACAKFNTTMPVFTVTGTHHKDLWLVDGKKEFGFIPGGIVSGVAARLPIWLTVGTMAYGELHIRKRHGHWVSKQKKAVPELVYEKLGQPGLIYCTEESDKFKISLRLNPSSLLILNLIQRAEEAHFSVTSLYMHPTQLDGDRLGRYPGRR